ncbi:MAG: hypothetical protein ABH859_02435 [Pseudomonadota bacterium]
MLMIIFAILGLISAQPDFAEAPPIGQVQQQALNYAGFDNQEPQKWKKRARISALLPRFQADYSHRVKNLVDVNIDDNVYVGSSGIVVGPEESGYSEGSDLYQSFGVRAVWSLNELLFSRDSLAVSQQALKIMRERNLLLEIVNKHYYERKKLLGEIAILSQANQQQKNNPKLKHQLFLKQITFEQETANLDALTGGWFSQQLE